MHVVYETWGGAKMPRRAQRVPAEERGAQATERGARSPPKQRSGETNEGERSALFLEVLKAPRDYEARDYEALARCPPGWKRPGNRQKEEHRAIGGKRRETVLTSPRTETPGNESRTETLGNDSGSLPEICSGFRGHNLGGEAEVVGGGGDMRQRQVGGLFADAEVGRKWEGCAPIAGIVPGTQLLPEEDICKRSPPGSPQRASTPSNGAGSPQTCSVGDGLASEFAPTKLKKELTLPIVHKRMGRS